MPTLGILVNGYLDQVGIYAGGNAHAIHTARHLHGFRIVFFGPERARAGFLAAVPGSEYVAMPDFPALSPRVALILRAFAGLAVRRQLRECDALLATSHLPPDVIPALAARGRRTVVIVHHLIGKPAERSGGKLYNTISWLGQAVSLALVRRFAARVAFVSPYVMREGEWLTGGRRAYLVPNAVETPAGFVPRAQAQRTGALYLGRLHPMKRVSDALVAWSQLPGDLRSQPLRIVGGDQAAYELELRALAQELGIASSVQFAGHVDEAAKWRLFDESALLVFPSVEEGFGLVIAEAMAAGAACVTYDLPVYREIFPQGRMAVPVADVDALAAACAQLLHDVALRQRVASEGVRLASTFSWERSAQALCEAVTF